MTLEDELNYVAYIHTKSWMKLSQALWYMLR